MAPSEELDLESIAAFIDGRLSGAERERIAKLLSESEEAFEVYAGAMQARADLGGDGSIVPIAARRGRRVKRWWVIAAPVAAAAALMIAVLPVIRSRSADGTLAMRAESIAEPLTNRPQLAMALDSGWAERRWSVTRGGRSSFVDSTAALRLGVRATDLQVALTIGDRERASRVAAEIVALLGSVDLSDGSSAEYTDLRKRIANGDSIGQVAGAAATADDNLRELLLDSPWFGFGKWLAASELAAEARSTEFFKSTGTERFLQVAIQSGHFAPNEVEELRQIAAIAKRGVANNEFETMRARFAELIQRHAVRPHSAR